MGEALSSDRKEELMDWSVKLHTETLGVTQPALQALRNELAKRVNHFVAVIEIPAAGECHCYGFAIVDQTEKEVVIIGDGFRGDGGGEGGAGHRAAQALLSIFGIMPVEALPEEGICFSDDVSMYRDVVTRLVAMTEVERFVIPSEQRPKYPDWCYASRW